jgi:hypothetical protein
MTQISNPFLALVIITFRLRGYQGRDPQDPSNFIPGDMTPLVSQGDRYVGFGAKAVPAENGSVAASPHIDPCDPAGVAHQHIAFHKTRWAPLAFIASIGTYF